MSEHDSEPEQDETGIPDDQLPEDLVPGEDNPLAEGLDDGETVDDLLDGGKPAEQSEDSGSGDSGSGSSGSGGSGGSDSGSSDSGDSDSED